MTLPVNSRQSTEPDLSRRDALATMAAGISFFLTSTPSLSAAEEPETGVSRLSQNVVTLAQHFEGLRLDAYRCPAGVVTIGYGHTGKVKMGDKLANAQEAEALLMKDMESHRAEVLKVFAQVPLTQPQLDALTSASFNCGCLKGGKSGLARHLLTEIPALNREIDPAKRTAKEESIVSYLCRYNRADGKFMDGLLRRRLSEGLVLIGEQNPVVQMKEYNNLKHSVMAELPKESRSPGNQEVITRMVQRLVNQRRHPESDRS